MPRPPGGFEAEKFPLKHRVVYSFGLGLEAENKQATICTLVKNYKGADLPSTTVVNPHNPDFVTESGAICAPMSIITNLKLSMSFSITEQALETDGHFQIKFNWMPIFFSFPEKLDAADEQTTTTVASLLNLTKDATQEDVIPTWSTTDLNVTAPSAKNHPLSTVNLTEVATTHIGLTTDAKMESVVFDRTAFLDAMRYYTNKGALKACVGRTRHEILTRNRLFKNTFIKKFVPRPIRRIVPYSWFGINFFLPHDSSTEQFFKEPKSFSIRTKYIFKEIIYISPFE